MMGDDGGAMLTKKLANPNPILLIILAAIGAVLFTISAGIFSYHNATDLVAASVWVDHTHDVLSSVQNASQLVERVEYSTRLYIFTQNEESLAVSRSSVAQLSASAIHLKNLVADNPDQTSNIQKLGTCSSNLTHDMFRLESVRELPAEDFITCRQALSLMSEEEQRLLKERTEVSRHTSSVSLITALGFICFSLAAIIMLFGMLLRDALARKKIAIRTEQINKKLAASVKTLQDQANESQLLTVSRNELQMCVDMEQVYRSASSSFSKLLPGTYGSLCIINNSRHVVEVVSGWGQESSRIPEMFPRDSCCGLRSGRSHWRRTGASEIDCTHFVESAPSRYLCIPMVAQGDTIGILYIECPTPELVPEVENCLEGVRQLIQLTGMTVAALQLRTKLENQSIRDSLTGLFNRHFMQIALERELARAMRQQSNLAVFMLDVDHFKRFNDQFGHAVGDIALKAVARGFLSSIRTEDIACRYGGEEFVIILPDVTAETAYQRAEEIRQKISLLDVLKQAGDAEITISIGVSIFPLNGRTVESLLKTSDEALYRAKHQGRNRVICSEVFMPAVDEVTDLN